MTLRRSTLIALSGAAVAAIVAGCTSGSDGDTTPSATRTVTSTDTVSSAAPPTGSGVPASTPPASTPPASTPPATGSSAPAGPGLCTPTVMTFRLGQGEGAAGTGYLPIVATNASQQPCVTTGFPGVAALDASGAQIAQARRVTGGAGVATIVVQPGQQVSALLKTVSMGTDGGTCPTAPAILFTMPDNTDSTRIVAGIPACADGVGIGPLVRGTTGT